MFETTNQIIMILLYSMISLPYSWTSHRNLAVLTVSSAQLHTLEHLAPWHHGIMDIPGVPG
jgi:hypothetical protein